MTDTGIPTLVGRYILHAPIASGGMATIHLARLLGAEGFSRTVAAKRLHPQFTEDNEFLKMFIDEARIASHVRHPNVVPMLDVVQAGAQVILVQEYVHGVPLDKLVRAAHRQKKRLPVDVVVAILSGLLSGLYAAHEAKDELGHPLGIVHRDISPQNVLIGVDGISRLLDFGVAKATLSTHVTRTGVFKGKLGYTSPELLRGVVTRATDVYAAGIVLWEALAGRRLHEGLSEAELISKVMFSGVPKLTDAVDKASVSPDDWGLLERLEPVVGNATAAAVEDRYATAADMQEALLGAVGAATPGEVSKWVKKLGKEYLEARERLIAAEESSWRRRMALPDALGNEEPSSTAPGSHPSATLRASVLSWAGEASSVQWPLIAGILFLGVLLSTVLILLWQRPMASAVVLTPSAALAPSAVSAPSAVLAPSAAFAPSAVLAAVSVETVRAPSPQPPKPSAVASVKAKEETGSAPSARAKSQSSVRAAVSASASRPVARAAAVAAPANECDPPFYFDGKKKVFKTGCL